MFILIMRNIFYILKPFTSFHNFKKIFQSFIKHHLILPILTSIIHTFVNSKNRIYPFSDLYYL